MAGAQGSDQDRALVWLVFGGIVAAGGWAWWKRRGRGWWAEVSAPDRLAELRGPLVVAVAGVVVLAAVLVVLVLWVRGRVEERDRFEVAARSVIKEPRGAKGGGRRLVSTSGVRAGRRRVTVRYPRGWAPTPRSEGALVEAVSGRAGRPMVGEFGRRRARFVPSGDEGEVVAPVGRVEKVMREGIMAVTSVEVVGGGPVPDAVVVRHEPSKVMTSEAWRARAEKSVSDQLPGGRRWRGEWRPDEGRVTFRPRPELPVLVPHPGAGVVVDGPYVRVGYGVTETGEQQVWDVLQDPHCLVIGSTSTGKTRTLETIITGFLASPLHPEAVLCDPKRFEMRRLKQWPGVTAVATSTDGIAGWIDRVHEEMLRRNEILEHDDDGEERIAAMRPILLGIDELPELMDTLAKLMPSKSKEHPSVGNIWSIARMGRAVRIHLLLAAQRPDVKFIEGATRDNISHRISLGPLQSAQGAVMMWGSAAVGRDVPEVKGRATAKGPRAPREVQVYYTDLDDKRSPAYGVAHDPAGIPASSFEVEEPVAVVEERPSVRPDRVPSAPRAKRSKRGPLTGVEAVENLLGSVSSVTVPVSEEVGLGELRPGDRVSLDVDGSGAVVDVDVESVGEVDGDGYVEVGWCTGTRREVVSLSADERVVRHPAR